MSRRLLSIDLLPAALLTLIATGTLGYERYAPVPGAPVAAVFRPGLGPAAAIGGLGAGWQVLGLGAARPLVVLFVRAATPGAAPSGAWLLLRADGAGQCTAPPT